MRKGYLYSLDNWLINFNVMVKRIQDPVDTHVGKRLRTRRTMLGLSQEKLGEAVGVTFQMIQKYERGSCRVGASRLQQMAHALNVPVAWFFDEYSQLPATQSLKVAEDRHALSEDIFTKRETIQLLKAYYSLAEESRKHVLAMVKGLAAQGTAFMDGAASQMTKDIETAS